MGQTYTRQSSYTDGDVITAAHTNDEFNQLLAAFAASTGHTHDGTTGEGGPVTALLTNSAVIGASDAADIVVTFDTGTVEGVFKFMVDEDYFEFSDDVLIASTEKLQFRDTAIYINSSTDGQLDIVADAEVQIAATTVDINGAVDISGATTIGGVVSIPDGSAGSPSLTNTGDTNAGLFFSAADTLAFSAGGTAQFTMADGAIAPVTDSDVDLGTSSLYFKNAYIDAITTTGDVVIGGVTTFSDGTAGAPSISNTGDANNGLFFSAADALTYTSGGTAQVTFADGVVKPVTDSDVDLGTSSLYFKDAYIDSITTTGNITSGGTVAGAALDIDDVVINGSTIGHTDDTDLITVASGVVTVAGELTATTLDIGGTNITSTAAELNKLDGATVTVSEINILDGDTSASSVTVADADRVVLNDGGTMKQVAVTSLAAYFDDEITAMPNLVTTAATTVGALDSGSITSGFGTIDTGSSTITTTGLITGGSLDIDDVVINGSTIGHTNDTDLITVADGIVTVAGEISVTTLDIGGTNVTSTATELNLLDGVSGLVQADFTKLAAVDATATELNIMDGNTSATSTTLADADRVVVNDDGTMKQVALTDFETYFESALDTLSNVTTVGTLNSGAISSGFGNIDVGSSNLTATGTISLGATSFNDNAITNVGDIALDSISADGTDINIAVSDNSGTALTIKQGSDAYLIVDTANSSESVSIGTGVSGTAITLGHSTSEVTVADNLTVTGNVDVDGITNLDNTDIDGTLVVDGSNISLDSSSTLNIDNSNTSNGITIGTATSGVPISIGHTTSEVTVNDNLNVTGNLTVSGTTTQVNTVTMNAQNAVVFEGTTADDHETTLTIVDPTADRTINLPNVSGTLPVLAAASTTQISSTPEELNVLDGITSSTAELNILDGATVVVGEINALDLGSTAVGNAIASKAVVLDSNKDYTGMRNLTITGELDAATLDVSGNVAIDGTLTATNITTSGDITLDADGADIILKDGGTEFGRITQLFGNLVIKSGPSGTAAFVMDASGNTIGGGNYSTAGSGTFASLDISGDVDIDGTLEADAITVNGTALAEFISDTTGAMVGSNTESGITVTYQDSDNTIDFAIDAAQTGITSLLATDIKIGEDDQTKIDFETADEIHFYAANAHQIKLVDGALVPVTDNDIDLGTSSLEFKDAFFDGTVTSDAFAGPLTGNVTGNVSGTAATVTGAAQSAITSLGTLTTLTVDDITINGSTISDAGALTMDVGGDIHLDASGQIKLDKDGTNFGVLFNSSSSLGIHSSISDKDIIFSGNDGGSSVTALTIDMSAAGTATFNNAITSGAVITSGAGLVIADSGNIGSASDTDAITIASGGGVTFSQGVTSTAAANTLGATSFNDANITNVGNIALDSITADGSTITITGNTTFADGSFDFDIASHDTSNGLKLGGTLVTSTAAELNILDGVTSTAAELNIIDGNTAASSVTVADADRVVLNDNGTMKQVAVTSLAAYFDDEITSMPNLITTAATTVGALNSGSITSGFGTIDNGASAITTTGVITGGTVEATTDTAAGDNAAMGYTSTEGLILTGQGSTNDVTIKNDADADVIEIPTGTKQVVFDGAVKLTQTAITGDQNRNIDLQLSNNFFVTMSADIDLTFTNAANAIGSSGIIVIKQDGTGGRDFTLKPAANVKTPANGATIVQATNANEFATISYYVAAEDFIMINYIGDYA